MIATKSDIISRLQKEVLSLQGFKNTLNSIDLDKKLGSIKYAFPNNSFPLGAIHEFICANAEDTSATGGFISGILSSLMKKNGAVIWINAAQNIFPPAMQSFGITPERIIFINLNKEKEMLWAMEEALKCEGLSGVVAQIPELGFTASRRLQLAVEQSHVTGFLLRQNPRNLSTTACVTRWKITSLPTSFQDEMPGVAFPRWNVELLKVRNGKPACWKIEFINGFFRQTNSNNNVPNQQQKMTG